MLKPARPSTRTGVFVDGSALDGPAGLRQVLLERSELFVQTFAEKLLTYAWAARSSRATCRPCARSCGARRATTIECRRSCTASSQSVPMQMRMKLPGDEPQQARAD